jgi:hypothetical protein
VAPNYVSYWFREIGGALVMIVATLRDGPSSSNCKTEHAPVISTWPVKGGWDKEGRSGKKEEKKKMKVRESRKSSQRNNERRKLGEKKLHVNFFITD